MTKIEEPWKKKIVTPRVAAAGIVESPDESKVLIIKRKYEPYGLAFPGGMMEIGETIEETAVREVYEETNIIAEPIGIIRVTSNPETDPRWHVVIFYFVMKAKYFEDPVAGDDAKEVFWMLFDSNKFMNELINSSQISLNRYRRWRADNRPELLSAE